MQFVFKQSIRGDFYAPITTSRKLTKVFSISNFTSKAAILKELIHFRVWQHFFDHWRAGIAAKSERGLYKIWRNSSTNGTLRCRYD